MEIATFGAGCFWGTEELFRQIRGVKETAVGYMGGTIENPSFENLHDDETGHVEVVQIKYDPKETSYEKLLEVFWIAHYPTQTDGQGNDKGSLYRPVIFYHTTEQKELATKSKKQMQKNYSKPIVTSIEPVQTFWPAEEYHQRYLQKRGGSGYCHINVKEILKKVK